MIQPIRTNKKITTLIEVRRWLMRERTTGVQCPCCDQYARIYRRRLSRSMANALIELYRAGGTRKFVHGPTVLGAHRGEEARLSYWGLIEESTEKRPDGGRRGWWKVTKKGQLFINNTVTVPEYALVYNGKCLELRGDPVRISDALGRKFNLKELMKDGAA